MLRTALALAKKGRAIFPCGVRAKRPATVNGVKDATRNAETIEAWWQQDPEFNIGVACGAVSGIFVVDVDGVDAEAELNKLEREYGTLPPSVEVITPRPGRHIYFQAPQTSVRNSAGKIAPGVDVRGDNGYVISPPSVLVSGRRYAWSVDSASVIAEAPDWLLARITGRSNGNGEATAPALWRELAANGVDEGQRDCTVAKLCGHLLRRFVDPFVVLELMQCWNETRCRPPLPASDVVRIVGSICDAELRRRGHAG